MSNKYFTNNRIQGLPFLRIFVAVAVLSLTTAYGLAADYVIGGHVSIERAIEGVPPGEDPPPPDYIPVPAATIEVYQVGTSVSLGTGSGNLYGYYNAHYQCDTTDATVYIVVAQIVNGERTVIGVTDKTIGGGPIQVGTNPLVIRLKNESTTPFEPIEFRDHFSFTQVGKIAALHINNNTVEGAGSVNLGLTKDVDPITKPGTAFGKKLDIYGLFGENDNVYYYRMKYKHTVGTEEFIGYIDDPLYKINYRFTSNGVVAEYVKMGPLLPSENPMGLENVYTVNERLIGYSPYWTEVALRARWDTEKKTGLYNLSIDTWRADGSEIHLSSQPYSELDLRLVNNAPECNIYKILYLDGSTALDETNACDILTIEPNNSNKKNLMFDIKAWQQDGFVGSYALKIYKGNISNSITEINPLILPATGIDHGILSTDNAVPPVSGYENCGYRFHLHIWPRITNGYDPHIYEAHKDWNVYIKNQ